MGGTWFTPLQRVSLEQRQNWVVWGNRTLALGPTSSSFPFHLHPWRRCMTWSLWIWVLPRGLGLSLVHKVRILFRLEILGTLRGALPSTAIHGCGSIHLGTQRYQQPILGGLCVWEGDTCREMPQAIPLGSVNFEIRAKRTLLGSLLESLLSICPSLYAFMAQWPWRQSSWVEPGLHILLDVWLQQSTLFLKSQLYSSAKWSNNNYLIGFGGGKNHHLWA